MGILTIKYLYLHSNYIKRISSLMPTVYKNYVHDTANSVDKPIANVKKCYHLKKKKN